jgi:dTDP-4-amino-4,6-dideoxy-D-glucose ammonia-lyase
LRRRVEFDLSPALLEPPRGSRLSPRDVAIVGAGRWAKVLCDALTELPERVASIHLVAQRNYVDTCAWLEKKKANGSGTRYERVEIASSLSPILEASQIGAAFVTRMASEHYEATHALLTASKHVLVEKPFVLRTDEARELVALASEKRRLLVVGYEYLFSRAMHHFRDTIRERLGEVERLHFVWDDRPGVEKWGVAKTRDFSANVITDLYPHVLSQLHVLLGPGEITLRGLSSGDGCWQAELEFTHGSTEVTASLNKEAERSRRSILAASSSGGWLELDFTEEPGRIRFNGESLPEDERAKSFPRSVTSEIIHFLTAAENLDMEAPNTGAKTLHFVEAMERANEELSIRQTAVLREHFWQPGTDPVPESVMKILRHHLVSPLLRVGLVDHPKDTEGLDFWASKAFRVMHRFSLDPWATQESVLEHEQVDHRDLLKLNRVLRESDFIQHAIVEEGVARKYWSTILPLIETGSIDAVLSNRPQFPLRVGVYAAVSCMFYCSFCGREPGVRYQHANVETGNQIFDWIFADMPQGISTLSLGGGLEPLTNPRLDDVIRSAKRHGHRVPLVTNGYMLTPSFVARHPGLWDLDVFRISWYGVDDDSYHRVTKRRGAFDLVKSNIIEFLKERNRRGSRVKVGMNFIVLIDSTDQVLTLLDVIKEINAAVGGRGVDFLTLREDFSVPETEGLTTEERERLVEIFREFEEKRRSDCPELKVDFGYALYPLSKGLVGKPLAMVTHQGMRPKAYPQVSVAVDLLGDVYLYRDAAFLERPGADRYIIGRVSQERSLERVVADFLESGREIPPLPDDPALMDAFDHVVTKTIWQAESDARIGIPFNLGPIRRRLYGANDETSEPDGGPPTPVNYWQNLFGM